MSVALVGTGAQSTGTGGRTITLPTALDATMAVYAFAAAKLSSSSMPTLTGWTKVRDAVVGTGSDGVGTGQVRLAIYRKDVVSAADSDTTVAFNTSPSSNVSAVGCAAFSCTPGMVIVEAFSEGTDSSSDTTFNPTAAGVLGEVDGQLLVAQAAVTLNTSLSSIDLVGSGTSLGSETQLYHATMSGGNGLRWHVRTAVPTGGPASGASQFTGTLGAASTGGVQLMLLSETYAASDADTGAGSDGRKTFARSPILEAGTGVDAQDTADRAGVPDTGAGVDASPTVARTGVPDTASGAEAATALTRTGVPDTGHGAEAATVTGGATVLFSDDAAAAVEDGRLVDSLVQSATFDAGTDGTAVTSANSGLTNNPTGTGSSVFDTTVVKGPSRTSSMRVDTVAGSSGSRVCPFVLSAPLSKVGVRWYGRFSAGPSASTSLVTALDAAGNVIAAARLNAGSTTATMGIRDGSSNVGTTLAAPAGAWYRAWWVCEPGVGQVLKVYVADDLEQLVTAPANAVTIDLVAGTVTGTAQVARVNIGTLVASTLSHWWQDVAVIAGPTVEPAMTGIPPVRDADAGFAGDSERQLVRGPVVEVAAAVDGLARVDRTVQDSAAGVEAATTVGRAGPGDAAAGVDDVPVRSIAGVTDSAIGVHTPTVLGIVGVPDSGTGADTPSAVTRTGVPDAGTAADLFGFLDQGQTPKSGSDTAAAVDAITQAARTVQETAASADTPGTFTRSPVGDTASAGDVAAVVSFTADDTASTLDALAVLELVDADAAAASEDAVRRIPSAGAMATARPGRPVMHRHDGGRVRIRLVRHAQLDTQRSGRDTGDLVDAVVLLELIGSADKAAADTGTAVDALAVLDLADVDAFDSDEVVTAAVRSDFDVASGVDATTGAVLPFVAAADTASGADVVTVRALAAADTGSGLDAMQSLNGSGQNTSVDVASALDALAALTRTTVGDTGAGADAVDTADRTTVGDTGAGADVLSVAGRTVPDTAAGSEAVTAAARQAVADLGASVDRVITRALRAADTATAADWAGNGVPLFAGHVRGRVLLGITARDSGNRPTYAETMTAAFIGHPVYERRTYDGGAWISRNKAVSMIEDVCEGVGAYAFVSWKVPGMRWDLVPTGYYDADLEVFRQYMRERRDSGGRPVSCAWNHEPENDGPLTPHDATTRDPNLAYWAAMYVYLCDFYSGWATGTYIADDDVTSVLSIYACANGDWWNGQADTAAITNALPPAMIAGLRKARGFLAADFYDAPGNPTNTAANRMARFRQWCQANGMPVGGVGEFGCANVTNLTAVRTELFSNRNFWGIANAFQALGAWPADPRWLPLGYPAYQSADYAYDLGGTQTQYDMLVYGRQMLLDSVRLTS